MRNYDVAIASLAIDAPEKWTDNVISQYRIDGVVAARRGVTRKISHSAVLLLAVVRELHADAGLSVRDALTLAVRLLGEASASVPMSGHLRVTLDRVGLEERLALRLRDALESAPAPRRGRPPRRVSG
jgi:hypothetical protein